MAEEGMIQTASVMADMKRPFMKVTNRWDYLAKYIPWWKGYIRFRMYAMVFGLIGISTVLSVPPLGVLALAAATYYWQMHILTKERLESQRSVLIGH